MKRHLLLLYKFLIVCFDLVKGLPEYQDRLPNGGITGIFRSRSFGHRNPLRKDSLEELNQFAIDFRDVGYIWSQTFCETDSDGDGYSNGVELGDPDCLFSNDFLFEGTILSHPGDNASTPDSPQFETFIETSYDEYILYSHMGAMLLSWFILMPVAMCLLSCDSDDGFFFKGHAIVSLLVVLLSSLAVIIMIFLGGNGVQLLYYSAHARLGGFCLLFSYVATFPACFDVKAFRGYWKCLFVLHRLTSLVVFVLCPIVVFLGVHMTFTEVKYWEYLDNWHVLIGVSVIFLFMNILSPCLLCCYKRRKQRNLSMNEKTEVNSKFTENPPDKFLDDEIDSGSKDGAPQTVRDLIDEADTLSSKDKTLLQELKEHEEEDETKSVSKRAGSNMNDEEENKEDNESVPKENLNMEEKLTSEEELELQELEELIEIENDKISGRKTKMSDKKLSNKEESLYEGETYVTSEWMDLNI